MKEEIWKDITGYEGLYQISNFGGVKTLKKDVIIGNAVRHQEERMLKCDPMKKGYLRASLSKNGVIKRVLVHRLVYEHFNGPIIEGLIINHKDRNKHNNDNDNLELVTYRRNTHHYRESTNRQLPIGVRKMRGKYQARLNVSSKVIYLGVYDTPAKASEIFQSAVIKLNNAV